MKPETDRNRVSQLISTEMRYYTRAYAFTLLTWCTFSLSLVTLLFTVFSCVNTSFSGAGLAYVFATLAIAAVYAAGLCLLRLCRIKDDRYSQVMFSSALSYAVCAANGFILFRTVWHRQLDAYAQNGYEQFVLIVASTVLIIPALTGVVYLVFLSRPVTNGTTRRGGLYLFNIAAIALAIPLLKIGTYRILRDFIVPAASVCAVGYMSLMLSLAVRYFVKGWLYKQLMRQDGGGISRIEPIPLPEPMEAPAVGTENSSGDAVSDEPVKQTDKKEQTAKKPKTPSKKRTAGDSSNKKPTSGDKKNAPDSKTEAKKEVTGKTKKTAPGSSGTEEKKTGTATAKAKPKKTPSRESGAFGAAPSAAPKSNPSSKKKNAGSAKKNVSSESGKLAETDNEKKNSDSQGT